LLFYYQLQYIFIFTYSGYSEGQMVFFFFKTVAIHIILDLVKKFLIYRDLFDFQDGILYF